ncbi:hypothetical protein [Treponema saccharophilum]|uniref:hypothetical protein n=1 Tax=Treponema saccharophilum TaxID=165 RepID=UPI00386D5F64
MLKSTVKVRFASLLALAVFLAFGAFYIFTFVRCFFAASVVQDFSARTIMRIVIYGTSRETVSARVALVDTSGREFAVLDRSWSGQNLCVEFSSASFGGKKIQFPVRVYSEQYLQFGKTSVYKGTRLARYYLYDGICAFVSEKYPRPVRRALGALGYFADFQSTKFRSRYSESSVMNLSALVPGETYDIVTDSTGSLRLLRM